LRGFYETLRARRHQLDAEGTDLILDSMAGQLDRLERLVGDLLLVADAHHGVLRLNHDRVDLRAMIERDVCPSLALEERSRVRVEVAGRVYALADPSAVERIVRALVGNALKHTDGQLRIHVSERRGRALLEVVDDGAGIAPWEHERIFERFARLGDHLHRVQGSGLGLSIARSLARAQDGDIELDSDVGRGSVFRLVLPLAPSTAEPVEVLATDAPSQIGWRGNYPHGP
ncbi:MAG TPA: HAMP domain-containing sensor histidine kinase, partial [Nitriliruptorales bacterium]